MLDLHKLRIFMTVARLESFTRAADRLHMTQPTVSQQLAMLETMVGTPLIERDTRHLRLTAAGTALLPYAEKLLALATEADEATRAAAGLASRTLRLGVGHTLATYLLPDVLSRFRVQYPRYVVRITVGNTTELLSLVASDSIDLALVGSPAEHPDVTVMPFMQDRLVVIVAPNDGWANRTEVTLDELRSRILLTREAGSALYRTIERLLGEEAFTDDRVIVLGETEAIKRSVEAGLGVALVQGIAIEREIAAGNLVALSLRGGDDTRTYLIAQRKKRELSAAAKSLIELLGTS
jgi:LysR family transcriptional regulator, low CO2-responsive transcriptional regulator